MIGQERTMKLTFNNRNIKVRKIVPVHALTKIQEDKTKKIPRKEKHKHINTYEV